MTKPRVMMIGLDGFELSIAERLIAEGRLPALERVTKASARFLLEHGPAKRTGLAWEHVSSGLSPEDAGRWAATAFDPATYEIRQFPAATEPFPAALDRRCVVFDPPYFDLAKAPKVEGITNWGAHDPGVPLMARPASIIDEMERRFGGYPGRGWIYGFTWPSAARSRKMAEALEQALDVRAAAAEWLFGERLPDWELGIMVVSEFHSSIEAFWHGVDETHPLHELPSAPAARNGVERIYEAADKMIGRLAARFPEAQFVIFSMHGMGPNHADVASMALLPELLYRDCFGSPLMRQGSWPTTSTGVPIVTSGLGWGAEVSRALPRSMRFREPGGDLWTRIKGRLPGAPKPDPLSVDWMPAARYRRYWQDMPAFALPAYYDGQIRINLQGREAKGMVAIEDMPSTLDRIEKLLHECRDVITGEPVVEAIERKAGPAGELDPTDADLLILWRNAPLGIVHPLLGQIGPLPYRRTGGHTGKAGVAYILGGSVQPGDKGICSSFDVVPTVIEMLGAEPSPELSGHSRLANLSDADMIAAQ